MVDLKMQDEPENKYKNPILNEREKTHGSFALVAALSQKLKTTIDLASGEKESLVQKEAIEMICLKLARIRCGNPNEKDHWKDIAGYAELVVKDLEF